MAHCPPDLFFFLALFILAAWPLQRATLHQARRLGLHHHLLQAGQPHPTLWYQQNDQIDRKALLHFFFPNHAEQRMNVSAVLGNGDILSYEDAARAKETGVSGIMIARLVYDSSISVT